MSSLVKTSNLHIDKQTKRVIDTNELVEAKLAKIREIMERDSEAEAASSFVPGLKAEALDITDALFADADGDGAAFSGEGLSGVDENGDGFVSGIIKAIPEDDSQVSEEIIGAANAKGEQIVQRSIMQAQEILADAQKQAQEEAIAIKEEAEKSGYADGLARAERELHAAEAELDEKARKLQEDYERQIEEIEPLLVEKITDIYQYFFGVDLSNKKRILLHLIANTMRHIDGTKNFLIHVSREDVEYVSGHKDQVIIAASSAGSVVEIIEDISLHKNECMIETDGGIFDCSLDTELKELTRKIRLLSYTGQN